MPKETIKTKQMKAEGFKFGDYVTIEQKRFGVENEHYHHKVIGVKKSNTYVTVPVQNRKEVNHGEVVDVVCCVCCGVDEREIFKYRVEDVVLLESQPETTDSLTPEEFLKVDPKRGFPGGVTKPQWNVIRKWMEGYADVSKMQTTEKSPRWVSDEEIENYIMPADEDGRFRASGGLFEDGFKLGLKTMRSQIFPDGEPELHKNTHQQRDSGVHLHKDNWISVQDEDVQKCERCGSSNLKHDGALGHSGYVEMEHSWIECLDCKHCWD